MNATLCEIFVFRQDHHFVFNSVPPDLWILGISEAKFDNSRRIAASNVVVPQPKVAEVGHQRSASRRLQDRVIYLIRSILQASANIFRFQIWKVPQNLAFSCTRCQHFQHVFDANAHSTDARASAALLRIKGNAFGELHTTDLHDLELPGKLTEFPFDGRSSFLKLTSIYWFS
jgi:hypothetical protein